MLTEDSFHLSQTPDNAFSEREALNHLSGFCELLASIDQRLMKEDPEYRAKYYQKSIERVHHD